MVLRCFLRFPNLEKWKNYLKKELLSGGDWLCHVVPGGSFTPVLSDELADESVRTGGSYSIVPTPKDPCIPQRIDRTDEKKCTIM